MKSYAGRSETAYLLEMQGRMVRVCLREFKRFVGLFTKRSRKGVAEVPKSDLGKRRAEVVGGC